MSREIALLVFVSGICYVVGLLFMTFYTHNLLIFVIGLLPVGVIGTALSTPPDAD